MTWQLMNTGFRPGSFNMALDEQLAFALKDGFIRPTVRFYGWNPHAVSMGFNQREEEFNLPLLRERGIDLVRRPTGGKAILHAHELTYSVVARCDTMSPREIYNFVNQGLLCGLRRLGIEAELSGRDDALPELYREPASIPCFATTTRYEIQFNHKKLIGSAQRRFQDVVLQHGSLLLGTEHRAIVDFIAPELRHIRGRMGAELQERTIEVETILQRTVSFDEAAASMREGFEETWGITFERETMDGAEPHLQHQSTVPINELSGTP